MQQCTCLSRRARSEWAAIQFENDQGTYSVCVADTSLTYLSNILQCVAQENCTILLSKVLEALKTCNDPELFNDLFQQLVTLKVEEQCQLSFELIHLRFNLNSLLTNAMHVV